MSGGMCILIIQQCYCCLQVEVGVYGISVGLDVWFVFFFCCSTVCSSWLHFHLCGFQWVRFRNKNIYYWALSHKASPLFHLKENDMVY